MTDIEETVPTGMARYGIVLGTVLAVLVQAIDTTIAAVALPRMQGSLSASQDEISWVITSYIVAVAILTAPTGWLSTRYGRKRVMLIAVLGFTVASVLTGMAQTLFQVVAFRFLQGAFGAPLVPLAQSMLLDAFPRKEALRATAWWSIGGTLGPIIGPNVGGWITENWNWRWCFFINVPIGILCLICIAIFVTDTRKLRIGFDWFGFAVLGIFIAAAQLVLDRGSNQDWFSSHEIQLEACIAGLAAYIFAVHSLTSRKGFLDFSTLRDRNFLCGNAFSFVFSALFVTLMVLIPAFLQTVLGDPVELSGSLMMPRSIGAGIVILSFGRFGARFDPRVTAFVGLTLVTWELLRMSQWTADVSSYDVGMTCFLQGFGTGLASVSMQGLSFSSLPPERRDDAVTLYSLLRNFGQSIGVSAVTALLVHNSQVNHATLAAHVTRFNHALTALGPAHFWNMQQMMGRAALDAEIGRQATLIAYLDDFRLMMFMSLFVIPFAFFFRIPTYMRRA